MKYQFYKLITVFSFILMLVSFISAQTEREKGIELYEKGDYKGAAEILKKAALMNDKDFVAAHYWGLSLEKDNRTKEAIEVFENNMDDCLGRVVEKIESRFGGIRKINDKETAHTLVQKEMGDDIKAAFAGGKRLEEINTKKAASDKWQNKILSLQYFTEKSAAKSGEDKKDEATSVKIIKKPFAGYTDSARSNGINGLVRLWILFLPNGKTGLIVPLQRLTGGLTESAINAAKGIKFKPATKDGNPIAVAKQVEYSFAIYVKGF